MKKTWMVTGTSTGFGKELASLLAQKENINLVATARNLTDLDYLDQYDQGQIKKVKLDVVNHDEVKAAVNEATSAFESIDVLVNNAGLGYFGTFEESDLESVKYMMDVNVWGLVDLTRLILPTMRKQKSGAIVNFSSIGGLYSFPTLSFYHATKYAVEGISEALQKEVEPMNIKVMIVEPSGFRTDWAGRSSEKILPEIGDYKFLTEFLNGNIEGAHNEPGDPKVAAEIIFDQVENNYEALPLRLPLGKAASNLAIEKYEESLKNFKSLREISVSADK